jgi:hypothetical protein
MYQLTPGSNVSSIPFDDPATFKPPTSAILVSTLWSLSLVVSLSCALLASLLQQWARRYRHITQKENDPQKRALTRELMAQVLNKMRLSWLIKLEPLPFLLHTSIFLFLAGFVVYLFTFNNLVAELAGACAGTSLLSYLYVSLAPIYSRDSTIYTPITMLVCAIIMGIISLFHHLPYFVASRLTRFHPEDLDRIRETFQFYYQRMLNGTAKDVETTADAPSSGLATSVLFSTFDSLDGVSDLEQFLSYIPGFYGSTSVQEHFDRTTFEDFNSDRLPSRINFFLEHVLSSDLLTDGEKSVHIATCSKALNANTSLLRSTLKLTLQTLDSKIFDCRQFVDLALEQLRRVDADSFMKDYARCVMAIAISRVQLCNHYTWIDIARRYLNLNNNNNDQYSEYIHNLRLSSLIYLTQHLKDSQLATSDQFEAGKLWHNVLAKARNVEVSGTTGIARELGQKFIHLWDELASLAHNAPTDRERQNATYVINLLETVHTNSHGSW